MSADPHTHHPFSSLVILVNGKAFSLVEGALFTANELPGLQAADAELSPQDLFAEVSPNPKDTAILGLKNVSNRAWAATLASGETRTVEPARSIKLAAGTRIRFGAVEGVIEAGIAPKRPNDFRLIVAGKSFELTSGRRLTVADFRDSSTSTNGGVVAEVTRNPKAPEILGLKNLSTTEWKATVSSGPRGVAPGQSIKLEPETRIAFGSVEGVVHTHSARVRSGSGVRPGRLLLSMAIASLLGVGARFLLGAFVHERPASQQGQLVAALSVGPEGAKANLPGGGYIDIPRGAISKPTTINVIKRPVEQQVRLNSPSDGAPLVFPPAALSVYQLTPLDTVLSQPIELALPVPAGQKGFVFVTANGTHRALPGVTTGAIVRVSVNNFDFNSPGAITAAR